MMSIIKNIIIIIIIIIITIFILQQCLEELFDIYTKFKGVNMITLVSSVLAALHCKSSQAGVLCIHSSPSGLFDVIKLCIISVLGL